MTSRTIALTCGEKAQLDEQGLFELLHRWSYEVLVKGLKYKPTDETDEKAELLVEYLLCDRFADLSTAISFFVRDDNPLLSDEKVQRRTRALENYFRNRVLKYEDYEGQYAYLDPVFR